MEYTPINRKFQADEISRKYASCDLAQALFVKSKRAPYAQAKYDPSKVNELISVPEPVLLGAYHLKKMQIINPRTTIFDNVLPVLSKADCEKTTGALSVEGSPVEQYMGFLSAPTVQPEIPFEVDTFRAVVMATQHVSLINGIPIAREISTPKVLNKTEVFTKVGLAFPVALKEIVGKVMQGESRTLKGKQFASELYATIHGSPHKVQIIDDFRYQATAHVIGGFYEGKTSRIVTPVQWDGRTLDFGDGEKLPEKYALAQAYLHDMRAMRGDDEKDLTIFGNSSGLPYNTDRRIANALYMASAIKVFCMLNRPKTLMLSNAKSYVDLIMKLMHVFFKSIKVESIGIDSVDQIPKIYAANGKYVCDAYPDISFYLSGRVEANLVIDFKPVASFAVKDVKLDAQMAAADREFSLKPNEIKLYNVHSAMTHFFPYKSPHNLVAFKFGSAVKPPATVIVTPEAMSRYLELSMKVNFIRNFPYMARITPYNYLKKNGYQFLADADYSFRFLKRLEASILSAIEENECDETPFNTPKVSQAKAQQSALISEHEYSLNNHAYQFKDVKLVASSISKLREGETVSGITLVAGRLYEHACSLCVTPDLRVAQDQTSVLYVCELQGCGCVMSKANRAKEKVVDTSGVIEVVTTQQVAEMVGAAATVNVKAVAVVEEVDDDIEV